jgi:F-type H+-transporting ATPase subunit a
MDLLQPQREIVQVTPEPVAMIGNFKITGSTTTSVLILILLILFGVLVVRNYKTRPNKSQTLVEIMVESMFDFITQITGSKKYAEVLFPLIASLFVYVGFSNLITILVPGLSSIKIGDVALFRSPTTDFNTTFGLALGSVVLIHIVSIKEWGILGHLGKFFKFKEVYLGFKKGLKSGVMELINFAIGLLDVIGEVAKVVSLSLRLFGNMYAGEILALIIMGAFAYVVPLIWAAMNLLAAVIQAIVFGALVTAYYMLAVKIKEAEEGS